MVYISRAKKTISMYCKDRNPIKHVQNSWRAPGRTEKPYLTAAKGARREGRESFEISVRIGYAERGRIPESEAQKRNLEMFTAAYEWWANRLTTSGKRVKNSVTGDEMVMARTIQPPANKQRRKIHIEQQI